jgi:hypothetical protein
VDRIFGAADPSSTYIHLSNVIADNPKMSPLSKKHEKVKEAAVSCEGKQYLDKVFTVKVPKNTHNHNVPTQSWLWRLRVLRSLCFKGQRAQEEIPVLTEDQLIAS